MWAIFSYRSLFPRVILSLLVTIMNTTHSSQHYFFVKKKYTNWCHQRFQWKQWDWFGNNWWPLYTYTVITLEVSWLVGIKLLSIWFIAYIPTLLLPLYEWQWKYPASLQNKRSFQTVKVIIKMSAAAPLVLTAILNNKFWNSQEFPDDKASQTTPNKFVYYLLGFPHSAT